MNVSAQSIENARCKYKYNKKTCACHKSKLVKSIFYHVIHIINPIMTMRKNFITCFGILPFILAIFAGQAAAQTTLEELNAHPEYTSSGYLIYPDPDKNVKYTRAPAGYKPFYISHYGRHGSRYYSDTEDYKYISETLSKADAEGKLTQEGKYLLIASQILAQKAAPHAGDLSDKGVKQQEGIAKRMARNFPELFKSRKVKGQKIVPHIDAYASTSGRCIVSMAAFAASLSSSASEVDIRYESGKNLMDFICRFDWNDIGYTKAKAYTDESDKLWAKVNPKPLMNKLFNDTNYVTNNIDANRFYNKLFEIMTSIQNADESLSDIIHANLCDITTNKCYDIFDSLFTTEESITRWQAQNAWWYSILGTSPLQQTTHGIDFAKTTLQNILTEADRAIASGKAIYERKKNKSSMDKFETVATLRFGHDAGILPLAGLMQLSIANAEVTDLSKLYMQWTDFRIIPMSANLQIVFYKKTNAKKSENAPILVKFLYNEREVTAPIPCMENSAIAEGDNPQPAKARKKDNCPAAPYYRWNDVRKFYESRIAQ